MGTKIKIMLADDDREFRTLISGELVGKIELQDVGSEIAESKSDFSFKSEINRVMRDLGIPAHIHGYQYIRDALLMEIEQPGMVFAITNELYPAMAKKYDTTPSRVERAIRHAIDISRNRGSMELQDEIFGYTINVDKGKPTNAHFISTIVDYLRQKKETAT